MASPFWTYFSEKLHWPQAFAPGPLQALVRGLAHHLDTAREDMPYLRRQFFPGFCEGDLVPEHGLSRSLVRHPRETPERFRQRVTRAYGWHMLGGKTLGLPQILRYYDFDITRIENMRDSNPAQWAEFGIELNVPSDYADIVAMLEEFVWLVNECKPARSRLFRIYTSDYDRRPIVLSQGPVLGEGWLSLYSGVPIAFPPDADDSTLVSFGASRRFQAEAYLPSLHAASFGIESVFGLTAPYLDRFIVGRSRLSEPLPRNHPFVMGALFSILWADRQTLGRSWRGEWDARRWLDYTGFDRKLPRWRMGVRSLSRSQLVPTQSPLSDTNSRLGATFAVVIDNPPRLGSFALSVHDCKRRERRLHEMAIVTQGTETPPLDPPAPYAAGTAWLASSGGIPDPERVQQASLSELALSMKPKAWTPPETALPSSLALPAEALNPAPPLAAGTGLLSASGNPLPEVEPGHAILSELALNMKPKAWAAPGSAGLSALGARLPALAPAAPASGLLTLLAPQWAGAWSEAGRNWKTPKHLATQ